METVRSFYGRFRNELPFWEGSLCEAWNAGNGQFLEEFRCVILEVQPPTRSCPFSFLSLLFSCNHTFDTIHNDCKYVHVYLSFSSPLLLSSFIPSFASSSARSMVIRASECKRTADENIDIYKYDDLAKKMDNMLK
jgi:hypothetical protein